MLAVVIGGATPHGALAYGHEGLGAGLPEGAAPVGVEAQGLVGAVAMVVSGISAAQSDAVGDRAQGRIGSERRGKGAAPLLGAQLPCPHIFGAPGGEHHRQGHHTKY